MCLPLATPAPVNYPGEGRLAPFPRLIRSLSLDELLSDQSELSSGDKQECSVLLTAVTHLPFPLSISDYCLLPHVDRVLNVTSSCMSDDEHHTIHAMGATETLKTHHVPW